MPATASLCMLALLATAGLLGGCGEGTVAASLGTSTVPIQTAAGRTDYTAFGDSITCGYVAAGATTSSPYSIGDASCHTANAYPSYIASSTSLALHNYGIPGDQACDIWPRQIGPEGVSPTAATSPLYTVMIGTNDAHFKGAGAYEADYTACSLAALTWLALPANDKVLAAAGTTKTWSFGTISLFGSYAISHIAGDTMSLSITTYGGPLYLWHTVADGDLGTATYAVDGTTLGSWSTTLPTPIATQNGSTNSVVAERITGLPAGAHTVLFTNIGGDVAVIGLGTPPAALPSGAPLVLVGSVPLPAQGAGDYLLAPDAAYTADMSAVVKQLAADGLPVRFAPNSAYMTGSSAEMTDLVHVSPLGAAHLAEAFLAAGP